MAPQAFALILPVRFVGALGDSWTYECVVTPRAVQTTDFMIANRRSYCTNCS